MDTVLWTCSHPGLTGAELCRVDEHRGGYALRGRVVAVVDQTPLDVQYRVALDGAWRTRRVQVRLETLEATRRLEMEHDGQGRWLVDGEARPDLDGCIDVDLGVTPSTNTLPIRRLALQVGDEADLQAAWVRFPELTITATWQRYRRSSKDIYAYESGSFRADLTVDEVGLVMRYGSNLWRAAARLSNGAAIELPS